MFCPGSWVEPLRLSELFPVARPLEVELGSGDGAFLAHWAATHPEHHFIGVERLLGRLRKLDRKAQRLGLVNLRLLRIEASYFLRYLIPPASIQALHVYFPDPWPKRRHRANRLVNATFAESARRALVPGGVVYVRTDDADYFAQMNDVFSPAQPFVAAETPSELAATLTDFERDFNARGVCTRRAAWRLGDA